MNAINSEVVFVTGNPGKAEYLSKFLGFEVGHVKLDLEEIQSMDLQEIVTKKVKEAFRLAQKPVLVEDVALEFEALGGLPGPFIKFFLDRMSLKAICDLVSGKSRKATARCVFGYYDGELLMMFEGNMDGEIATEPAGDGGYGWDKIFVPEGYNVTRASLSADDYQKTYLKIKRLGELGEFLVSRFGVK